MGYVNIDKNEATAKKFEFKGTNIYHITIVPLDLRIFVAILPDGTKIIKHEDIWDYSAFPEIIDMIDPNPPIISNT